MWLGEQDLLFFQIEKCVASHMKYTGVRIPMCIYKAVERMCEDTYFWDEVFYHSNFFNYTFCIKLKGTSRYFLARI